MKVVPSLAKLQIAKQVITGSITAASETQYLTDTTSAAVTITLPATAVFGDTILITDHIGNFATNNVTVARNGHNIQGLAEDLVIDVNYASVALSYVDTTSGWVII